MDILNAIDAFDDLLHEARPVPLTDSVRIDEQELRRAVANVRPAADEQFGRLRARAGPIGDVFGAIDELEAIAGGARRVPLISQVRVEKEDVYELLDRIRAALPAAVREARGA